MKNKVSFLSIVKKRGGKDFAPLQPTISTPFRRYDNNKMIVGGIRYHPLFFSPITHTLGDSQPHDCGDDVQKNPTIRSDKTKLSAAVTI